MTEQTNILVVDDDAELRRLIADFLGGHGFAVFQAANVNELRQLLRARRYDLLVLDLMMPGEDGLSALRTMRGELPPTIMLSAMGSDIDRIVGLELGADDYVAKPCNPRELLARIKAVLRRAEGPTNKPGKLLFGGWVMNSDTRELFAPDGTKVETTHKEWRVLHALVDARRRVLSRDELVTSVGGEDDESFDRAIDISISRLRRKLATHDARELIRTVRGEGYGFALEVKQG